jgi:hypothetical protein
MPSNKFATSSHGIERIPVWRWAISSNTRKGYINDLGLILHLR